MAANIEREIVKSQVSEILLSTSKFKPLYLLLSLNPTGKINQYRNT